MGVKSALASAPAAHGYRTLKLSMTGFTLASCAGHFVFLESAGMPIDNSDIFLSNSPWVIYSISLNAFSPFWELLCVDKGEVDVVADHDRMTLQKGEVIFHQPNEFHRVLANGVIAPNLVVIGFDCQSPHMASFKEKVLKVGHEEQELLARIIAEARLGFKGRLDNPYQEVLVRKDQGPFGAEQMIKIYLEQFLIQMYRRSLPARQVPLVSQKTPSAEDVYETILYYFEKNICVQLTIDQISRDNLISTSQLKKLFCEKAGTGFIEYFNRF